MRRKMPATIRVHTWLSRARSGAKRPSFAGRWPGRIRRNPARERIGGAKVMLPPSPAPAPGSLLALYKLLCYLLRAFPEHGTIYDDFLYTIGYRGGDLCIFRNWNYDFHEAFSQSVNNVLHKLLSSNLFLYDQRIQANKKKPTADNVRV